MYPTRSRARTTPKPLFLLLLTLCLFGSLFVTRNASAYPFMIRHGYSACSQCHADPSGGGVLTLYGRAIGDLKLRMHYNAKGEPKEDAEPSSSSGFLWGAWEPPQWLLLSGAYRSGFLLTKPATGDTTKRLLLMQADLRAVVKRGHFVAGGSLGFLHIGGSQGVLAQVTHREKDNLVSREHWLGFTLDDDSESDGPATLAGAKMFIRAGRINLPFGIRNIEHESLVRRLTGTDTNGGQQHGAAFGYNGESLRAEVMAIAGNFQVNPDAFRSRGYAGFLEYAVKPQLALGISSKITRTSKDLQTNIATTRQAHGIFGRWSPAKALVVSAEADFLMTKEAGAGGVRGYASLLQADVEVRQGLHFMVTGEAAKAPGDPAAMVGGWVSAWWFFLPHLDFRVDAMHHRRDGQGQTMLLAQFHAYL